MSENIQRVDYSQEDEIDLKELFLTIWSYRKVIVIFTTVVTLLSILFVLLKTPIYEAKAVVEIGSYKDESSRDRRLLDESNKLSRELNILYIDILKNEKERKAWIESISAMKRDKNFLEISSNALNNELAIEKLKEVVSYIQDKHYRVIDEIINYKELELKNLDRDIEFLKESKLTSLNEDIDYIKKVQIPSLESKISTLRSELETQRHQLKITEANIAKTKAKEPSLTALNVMEKRSLEESLSRLRLEVIDLEIEKSELKQKTLPRLIRDRENLLNINLAKLLEERELLQKSLLPHNYKNSAVVGEIMVNEYPIKPKKRLIVAVSFVTSLILSIFGIFFVEFIKGFREEEGEKVKSSN